MVVVFVKIPLPFSLSPTLLPRTMLGGGREGVFEKNKGTANFYRKQEIAHHDVSQVKKEPGCVKNEIERMLA